MATFNAVSPRLVSLAPRRLHARTVRAQPGERGCGRERAAGRRGDHGRCFVALDIEPAAAPCATSTSAFGFPETRVHSGERALGLNCELRRPTNRRRRTSPDRLRPAVEWTSPRTHAVNSVHEGEHCSRVSVPPPFPVRGRNRRSQGVSVRGPRRPRSSDPDLLTGLAASSRGWRRTWTERGL